MPPLGDSSYCGTCGKVTWTGRPHTCRPRGLAPENVAGRPGVFSTVTALNPSPPITKDKDLNATVLAEQEPVLTPEPSPAKPPEISEGDRYVALAWTAGGRTADSAAAYFAHLTRTAPEGVSPEDADRRARLVSAMAELEAQKCTQETARAALGLPGPRKPAAA